MNRSLATVLLLLAAAFPLQTASPAEAASDGVYSLSETPYIWDGTRANRFTTPTADYEYAYGDESSVSYTLPWQFPFYGRQYSSINVDTNGNIWFGATGVAHSFDFTKTGRGPVIAVWNTDLSSYFYGGAFVQRKTAPERVVVEWQAETYSEEGYYKPNKVEVVLYSNGDIRFDYASFNTEIRQDHGSGISQADGNHFLSVSKSYGDAYTLSRRSFLFTPKSAVPVGSVVINGGAPATNVRTATLTLTCTAGSSPCARMQFSTDNITWTSSAPFAPTRSIGLSGPNGVKTVYAKFTSQSGITSDLITASILFDAQTPTLTASVPSGQYTTPQNVTLETNEPAKIFYTLDGSIPTVSSPVYSTPIVIAKTSVLRFFAMDTATNKTAVVSRYYTVRQP